MTCPATLLQSTKGARAAVAALALRSYYPSSLHASATACITPLRELPSYWQSDKPYRPHNVRIFALIHGATEVSFQLSGEIPDPMVFISLQFMLSDDHGYQWS